MEVIIDEDKSKNYARQLTQRRSNRANKTTNLWLTGRSKRAVDSDRIRGTHDVQESKSC
jgi:hypothetical protein